MGTLEGTVQDPIGYYNFLEYRTSILLFCFHLLGLSLCSLVSTTIASSSAVEFFGHLSDPFWLLATQEYNRISVMVIFPPRSLLLFVAFCLSLHIAITIKGSARRLSETITRRLYETCSNRQTRPWPSIEIWLQFIIIEITKHSLRDNDRYGTQYMVTFHICQE